MWNIFDKNSNKKITNNDAFCIPLKIIMLDLQEKNKIGTENF